MLSLKNSFDATFPATVESIPSMPNSLLRVCSLSHNASALSKKEPITALDIDLDLCDEEAGETGLLHSYHN